MQSIKEKITYVKSTISGKYRYRPEGINDSGKKNRLEEVTTHSWEMERHI